MDIINTRINNFVNELFSKVLVWFGCTDQVSASVSFIVIIIGAVIIVAVFASAFLSSQYAEKDKKNRLVHFICGMILPWLYPLLIYQIFRPKKKIIPENLSEEKVELTTEQKMVKEFTELANDEHGNPRGPFLFILTNNRKVKVNRILEVRDNLIIISMTLVSGEEKKFRIPFEQIKSYSEI